MTSLLSAISGQFTRWLILSALFPAAVFVLLFLVAVAPLLPPDFALAAPRGLGTDWDVLSVTFATLVLAGVLYNLEIPLIQLYEGYPWRRSLFGRWRTRVHRARMEWLQTRAAVLYELAADRSAPTDLRKRLNQERSDVRRELMGAFPDRPDLVLPTRLGNIIRAFERYPDVQYGMDAIYLYPRLIAVIPPPYAAALGDARTRLTFLLGLSFLAAVLFVLTVAAGLLYLPPDPLARVAAPAVLFAAASAWLYRRSFRAAADWGGVVKGAFDLYRWALLDQLGHGQRPRTRAAERRLWSSIGFQMMGGDRQTARNRSEPWIDYEDPAAPAVTASTGSRGVRLAVSRGVESVGRRSMRVVVVVENRDQTERADAVVVTERLPEGLAYRWNSASVDGSPVRRVEGTGPYRFHLGDIAPRGSATLSYTVCSTHPDEGSRDAG